MPKITAKDFSNNLLEVALGIQNCFLKCVQKEGWFPEGVLRQTQVFDQYVAPLLEQNNKKVAFFLVDSLRFEMGRDLAEALEQLGEVETLPVASVLPTTTPCVPSALMPNADGTLRLVESSYYYICPLPIFYSEK